MAVGTLGMVRVGQRDELACKSNLLLPLRRSMRLLRRALSTRHPRRDDRGGSSINQTQHQRCLIKDTSAHSHLINPLTAVLTNLSSLLNIHLIIRSLAL